MGDELDSWKELLARHFAEIFAFERKEDEPKTGADALQLATSWHEVICEPANPKLAKYAKAISRILDEPATLYFAIEYRDATSLRDSEAFSEMMPLPTRFSKESEVSASWRRLKMLNSISFALAGTEAPRVPTSNEIQANITQFRAVKRAKNAQGSQSGVAPGSMSKAFYEKLLTVSEHLKGKAKKEMISRLHSLPVEQHAVLCANWAASPFKGRNDEFGVEVLTTSEKGALLALSGTSWADVEVILKQLNDLSRVQKSIPTNMLSQIESYATKLATDLTSGETDFSNLNLQSIGEDVLRQCSDEDINNLAANIGDILPAIGSLQASVHQQAGIEGNLPGMPNIGNLAAMAAMAQDGAKLPALAE